MSMAPLLKPHATPLPPQEKNLLIRHWLLVLLNVKVKRYVCIVVDMSQRPVLW